MKIYVNDKCFEVDDHCTIPKALNQINIDSKNIAIAVNNNVIQKKLWDEYKLSAEDRVMLIRATQGG
jgi:sulfur carrier protein